MTRKEKEQEVLELFGLKVGDKIKIEKPKNFYLKSNILQIVEYNDPDDEDYFGFLENGEDIPFSVVILFKEDWEKLRPSIKDKKCKDFYNCQGCPLLQKWSLDCTCVDNYEDKTLEEIYKYMENDLDTAKEGIYGDEK